MNSIYRLFKDDEIRMIHLCAMYILSHALTLIIFRYRMENPKKNKYRQMKECKYFSHFKQNFMNIRNR